MKIDRKTRWIVIGATAVVLYGLTWVGGPARYSQDVKAYAQELYDRVARNNREMAAEMAKEGIEGFKPVRVHEDGPDCEVKWCVPIFPGVMLADSRYSIGPGWYHQGVYVVVYYGWGTWETLGRIRSSSGVQALMQAPA